MDRRLALVLTDDSQNIRVLEQALPQFGLHVIVSRDGREALEWLDGAAPVLAVLDLQLPGSFGILTLPNLQSARLVILTVDVMCVHLTGRQADAKLLQPVMADNVADVLRQMPDLSKSP